MLEKKYGSYSVSGNKLPTVNNLYIMKNTRDQEGEDIFTLSILTGWLIDGLNYFVEVGLLLNRSIDWLID